MKAKLNTLQENHRQVAIRALKDQIYHFKKDNLLNEIPSLEAALKAMREPEIKEAKKSFEKINNIMKEAGVNVDRFYSYSGRMMYGANCVAATVDRYEYNDLIKVLKKKKVSFSSDNMGMDMVVYFTYLDPKDVLEENDEDEE